MRMPSQIEDLTELVATCCHLLFGKKIQSHSSIRLQHCQLDLLSIFIDLLCQNQLNLDEDVDTKLPLTFFLPLVEIKTLRESAHSVASCLDSFCESIGASFGMFLKDGKIIIISRYLQIDLDRNVLRCFVILSLAMNEAANRENFGQMKPSTADVVLTEIDKSVNYHFLCIPLPSTKDLLGLFLFPQMEGLLLDKVSAEVSRFWSPLLVENAWHIEEEIPAVANLVTNLSPVYMPPLESNSPILLSCVANSETKLCSVFSTNQAFSVKLLHSRLVAFITQSVKQLNFHCHDISYEQSMSRRPSAMCLKYNDSVCIAISRPPFSIFAILPPTFTSKQAITLVAQRGMDQFMQSHILCND